MKYCETTETRTGLPCRVVASWQVAVGSRASDAQLACARHLNSTCWLMIEAEGPRRDIALTVTPVRIAPLDAGPAGGW